MGFKTLERIHDIIVDTTQYKVEGNIVGYRNNVIELYSELRPFIQTSKDKQKNNVIIEGDRIRNIIRDHEFKFDKYGLIQSYDDDVIDVLDDFLDWIKIQLHNRGMLMPHGENKGESFF